MSPQKTNAVIYARFSSHNQRDESIDGQIRECTAFAEKNDFNIINTYVDRAISAKTDARPAFKQMILDSSKGAFEAVIVYQLDRFARNRYDSATYKAKLKRNGVRLISAKENITGDPAGIILESVLEGMAEYYSVELAQKVKRGMMENALAGRWASGIVPLGYYTDDEKILHIDEKQAPIVKEIFERYAKGEKIAAICRWLNGIHFTTRLGGKFHRSSFHAMLKNKIYVGDFVWGEVCLPNRVPALISRELFDVCQKRTAKQKHANENGVVIMSDTYLLTGKLHCAECNGPMVGISATNRHGVIYHYYACQNVRSHRTKCKIGYVPQDLLENAIVENAAAIMMDEQNLDLIAEQAVAFNSSAHNTQMQILLDQEKELQAKINNCAKAIEKGLISQTIIDSLNSYEAELDELRADIAKEKLLQSPILITKQHVIYFLSRFKDMPADEAKKYILDTLLNKIVLEKQNDGNYHVTVTYNYNDYPQVIHTENYDVSDVPEDVRNSTKWWR